MARCVGRKVKRVGGRTMLRYFVEYLPNPYTDLTRYFFMYAYSEKQIKEMMKDYELVTIDQTD